MGAGKTTVGKQLAKDLGLPFYDLDWYIESRMRKKISQIFEERGEEGFRIIERNMLHEVAEFEDVVISCGGGTPCFFDNMDFMNERGVTVLLQAQPSTLFNRLKVAKSQRPLLADKSDDELMTFIMAGLQKRQVFYSKAQYVFASDELESQKQIVDSIQRLKNLLISK